MSLHKASVSWNRETPTFQYPAYNREHTWSFDGGMSLTATAAPQYRGKPDFIDPEEAFVAALSSCHMLTFLANAARAGYTIDQYTDEADGIMEKLGSGEMGITRVTLRPRITFSGSNIPTPAQVRQFHDTAHHQCYIANSVKTEITVEMQDA